jgi:hypothetical protein
MIPVAFLYQPLNKFLNRQVRRDSAHEVVTPPFVSYETNTNRRVTHERVARRVQAPEDILHCMKRPPRAGHGCVGQLLYPTLF